MSTQCSPFLAPSPCARDKDLALIALSRQSTIPTSLRASSASDPTDEVTNTRFGSYPHSTLLGTPWGSQVRASDVSARDRQRGKKRKRGGNVVDAEELSDKADTPAFEAAASGFAHLLYPTPESWTYSLPHRTQVVYTPDYSYVLQRMHVRPGDTIIEAGAGSGSFSHAAARAVFNGYPLKSRATTGQSTDTSNSSKKFGKVLSFEYHEPRFEALKKEIRDHDLDSIVRVTHRDVYNDGFGVAELGSSSSDVQQTDAIFLDLPAPWTALKNLTRDEPSVLNSKRTVHICTFSPCIEQVQKTVDAMREHGWVDIDMVEIIQRRIEVRRERIGLHEEGLRGVQPTPADVDEAVSRLRENEEKQAQYHDHQRAMADMERAKQQAKKEGKSLAKDAQTNGLTDKSSRSFPTKQDRVDGNLKALEKRKPYKEGQLTHRTEAEVKTHTSYLVFAMMPMRWTEEDEAQQVAKWAKLSEEYKKEGVAFVTTKSTETSISGDANKAKADKAGEAEDQAS